MTKTKIVVNPPNNSKPITFFVEHYSIFEGMIFFQDKDNKQRGFPTDWCELQEVG